MKYFILVLFLFPLIGICQRPITADPLRLPGLEGILVGNDASSVTAIADGTNGYILTTDGAGNYSFVPISSILTFGSDNQVPSVNTGGTGFDYSSNHTFDGTILAVTGRQTIGNTGSTDALTITKSGSGDALVINESGSGVAANITGAVGITGALTATTFNGLIISGSAGTLTIPTSSSLIRSGAHAMTLTTSGATNVTFPTTGTLATIAGIETLTNKTLTSPVISTITNSAGDITLTPNPSNAVNISGGADLEMDGTVVITDARAASFTTGAFSNTIKIRSPTIDNGSAIIIKQSANNITGGIIIEAADNGAGGGIYRANGATGNLILRNGSTDALSVLGDGSGDVTITGDVSAANLTSGPYSPTLTSIANLDATPTAQGATYMRVGDQVQVSMQVTYNATAASTTTSFRVSLPVASNLANSYELKGVPGGSLAVEAGLVYQNHIVGDTVNDEAVVTFNPQSPSAGQVLQVMFMYTIN